MRSGRKIHQRGSEVGRRRKGAQRRNIPRKCETVHLSQVRVGQLVKKRREAHDWANWEKEKWDSLQERIAAMIENTKRTEQEEFRKSIYPEILAE